MEEKGRKKPQSRFFKREKIVEPCQPEGQGGEKKSTAITRHKRRGVKQRFVERRTFRPGPVGKNENKKKGGHGTVRRKRRKGGFVN